MPRMTSHRDRWGRQIFGMNGHPGSEARLLRRVLVVDDEPQIVEGLAVALSNQGYDVRTAVTLAEALVVLAEWVPDFVVSDYHMPGGNGGELFEAVLRDLPDVVEAGRFVFLTAHPDAVGEGPLARGVPVLVKPARLSELCSLLARAA